MNKKLFLSSLAASVLLVTTAYGFYQLGQHHSMTPSATIISGDKTANAAPKVLYWHDPMVPNQKFDKPGKSPFMDMELVPVFADANAETNVDANANVIAAAGNENTISINPRTQQNLGIRTAEVSSGSITSGLSVIGNVVYNERDLSLVQARSNGFVEKLFVRALLDPVKKGQALLQLYVPDWIAAQEEYLAIQRMPANEFNNGPDNLLDAARQRMRLVGMSEAQIHLVEQSGKLQTRVTVTAPEDGVVSELSVRDGMTVMAGAPLMRINGVASVWVNAEIPETAAAQLHLGNTVEARTSSLPGTVFKGKIDAILPQVNPSTRTLVARIVLANPRGQLVPGMFASIQLHAASGQAVLLIPTEAVIKTGQRSVVMVAEGSGKFHASEVETGTEMQGQTEIRTGLKLGQKIVISGQFLIDSEASLKASTTRLEDNPANPAKPTKPAMTGEQQP